MDDHHLAPPDGGRLLAIAAGTLGDLSPAAMVSVAAAAGWPAAGLALQSDRCDERELAETRRRLDDTGLVVLDVEAVFVTPAGDEGDRLVDRAAEVGARNLLVVSLGAAPGPFAERLGELCDRAEPAGIRCVVEFTPILSIPDLATALAVVRASGRAGAGILVDNLHLARSGGSPADLATVDAALMPYVQLCDAPAEPPDDLFRDALEGRCLPGEGGLPVAEYLRAVPASAAVSAEILSASLRAAHPDPQDRAAAVLAATRAALDAPRC